MQYLTHTSPTSSVFFQTTNTHDCQYLSIPAVFCQLGRKGRCSVKQDLFRNRLQLEFSPMFHVETNGRFTPSMQRNYLHVFYLVRACDACRTPPGLSSDGAHEADGPGSSVLRNRQTQSSRCLRQAKALQTERRHQHFCQ